MVVASKASSKWLVPFARQLGGPTSPMILGLFGPVQARVFAGTFGLRTPAFFLQAVPPVAGGNSCLDATPLPGVSLLEPVA